MNRGKLESWAVRLYMIVNRLRIPKSDKAEHLKQARIRVIRWNEETLVSYIESQIANLEVM